MKLCIFIAFMMVGFLAYAAQNQRCAGSVRSPTCSGRKDEGRRGIGCQAREMWYYNPSGRNCLTINYRGCGGNRNRFCKRFQCERSCRITTK